MNVPPTKNAWIWISGDEQRAKLQMNGVKVHFVGADSNTRDMKQPLARPAKSFTLPKR